MIETSLKKKKVITGKNLCRKFTIHTCIQGLLGKRAPGYGRREGENPPVVFERRTGAASLEHSCMNPLCCWFSCKHYLLLNSFS